MNADADAAEALRVQLERWRAALEAGAERVGWKLGIGQQERIGEDVAVGHLTSATTVPPGGTYAAGAPIRLRADVELAVVLGERIEPTATPHEALAAIAAHGVALELVDLGTGDEDAVAAVEGNVFHRVVSFGPFVSGRPAADLVARLSVEGRRRSGRVSGELAQRLAGLARRLDAVGQRPEPGDRVITGNIVQVPVAVGEEVVASIATLGEVRLQVAA